MLSQIDMATKYILNICIYTHRQMLLSALVQEAALSSERQRVQKTHGCSKSLAQVAVKQDIYTTISSKAQGISCKRKQKE